MLKGIDLLAGFPHAKYLTCIVSEVNRGDILDIVRFARVRGFVPVVGAYHWGIERYGKVERALINVRWLGGESLEPCDAGRYSIAIDASGNAAPCLVLKPAGNLLRMPLDDMLTRFDGEAIRTCSDRSSCNMLCSRVVGSALRHPVSALLALKAQRRAETKLEKL